VLGGCRSSFVGFVVESRIRRVLRSKEGPFLIGDFVCGRDIREVLDFVNVRCAIARRLGCLRSFNFRD
jgi:hypothetical protein